MNHSLVQLELCAQRSNISTRRRRLLMSAMVLAFLCGSLRTGLAATWYVATNGSDAAAGTNWLTAKQTIQAGVDAATNSDTVLVSNGVYATGCRVSPTDSSSNRVVITKNILVKSVNGPDVTSILGAFDGSFSSTSTVRCVYQTNGTLSGFTLTNGAAGANGGGIYANNGRVSNCVIVSCSTYGQGGGSYAYGSTLYNCILKGNSARTGGGGSAYGTLYFCSLLDNRVTASGGVGGGANFCILHSCVLSGNTVAGTYSVGGGSCFGTLDNCLIINNSGWGGGGSYQDTLVNCTLSGNSAPNYGGGAYGSTLNNCIDWANQSMFGEANFDDSCVIHSSCTTPMPTNGADNITVDPQFTDAATSNFHLLATSPCINAGSNSYVGGSVDLDGNPRIVHGTVDMGAYEVQGALTLYVKTNGNDSALGNSWPTAKQTIQAAVDAAIDGDLILVSNGVYAMGARVTPGYLASNRVVITQNVQVVGFNGASATTIQGQNGGTNTSAAANTRCVFMTNGFLVGFTLAGGGTTLDGTSDFNQSGAGVFAPGGTLSNCVITGCRAVGFGGGSCSGVLDNCILQNNTAARGGGSAGGTLNNCLLWANAATNSAGGSYTGALNNCIVWSNTAPSSPNYSNSVFISSCTAPAPGGAGNITNAPQFVDAAASNFHPSAASPCIDAGSNSYVRGAMDFDGNSRIARGVVDMGPYEYQGAVTFYVMTNGSDSANGHSWPAAKQTLQAAVDAAIDGDTVLASNGVYATGARVTPGNQLSNRVVITKDILVQSVNGPAATVIQGLNGGADTNLSANLRCVFITNGVLSGFTLSNGGAQGGTPGDYNRSGGGVFARWAVLSNCVITGCRADHLGGGAMYGTLNQCVLSNNVCDHGGGAGNSTLVNCLLTGNTANRGGGSDGCTLYNCTVWGNIATNSVGGSRGDTVYNSIVWSNTAPSSPNYSGSAFSFSCTAPSPGGTGNTTNDPLLVDASANNAHLSAGSPCIDAGSNAYAQGSVDFDGNPRIVHGSVDMGAYEVPMVTVTVQANDGASTVGSGTYIPGSNFVIAAAATNGHWFFAQWSDGGTSTSRAIMVPLTNITYTAIFTQYAGTLVFYVATNGADAADARSWPSARQTIQAGVNLAVAGDTVCVSNGVYASGVWLVPGSPLSNRVVVLANILLQSVNGPETTIIQGEYSSAGTYSGNVRCVYLNVGTLSGFTLSGGGTRMGGAGHTTSGAGVYGGGLVSNCIITGCHAAFGGGAAGCTLKNCRLIGNTAGGGGGGAYTSSLSHCVISGNTAVQGGGAYMRCQLTNCLVVGNTATNTGGGVGPYCRVCNSTIAGNSAGTSGGGEDYGCTNYNSIVFANTAGSDAPNWVYQPSALTVFYNSCTLPAPSSGTANVTADPLFVSEPAADYHLQPVSPCIDAGDNACMPGLFDLQGHPRLINDTIDIGAYERNPLWYVATAGSDANIGTNWATAKQSIQAALDFAYPYETVVVSNGIYASGARAVDGFTTLNRTIVSNSITLRSLNGPDVTSIRGLNGGASTDISANVRCVYIRHGTLIGFTLADGAAPSGSTSDNERAGGGVFVEDGLVSNCQISSCAAYNGGALCGGTAVDCTLTDNDALWYGGAASESALYNCTLKDNTSLRYGGGVSESTLFNCMLDGNAAELGGGSQNSLLYNCTLVRNEALIGGGSFMSSDFNCILALNDAMVGTNFDDLTCDLDHCCASPLPSTGSGNLAADPQFAGAGDYRLKSCSPCINAGENAYAQEPDLDNKPRIVGGIVDLGAYEFPVVCGYAVWAGAITNGLTNYDDCCTGDGYANLLKYATGSSATQSDALASMTAAMTSNRTLALHFNRSLYAPDVTMRIEESPVIADDAVWTCIATNIGGAGWSSPTVTEAGTGDVVSVTASDDPTAATNRFLRLRITSP